MPELLTSYKAALVAGTATTGGATLSLANPEGRDIIVERLILDVTTPSTGAATVDAGIAANGTTTSDILIDGRSVATAAGTYDNIEDQGTNGRSAVKWPAASFLTITPSASTVGMVGNAYIKYTRL